MNKFQFIVISYDELVSLLLMCGYSKGIAGLHVPEFDYTHDEKIKYIETNQEKLVNSGFIRINHEGKLEVDPDIGHLLYILTHHNFAYIMIRQFPNIELYETTVYEICGHDILEHMWDENGIHRFMIIPNADDLYARIRKLVPITDTRSDNTNIYTISEKTLNEIIENIKRDENNYPLEILMSIGMTKEIADNCVSGIKNPDLSVSIMGIVYDEQLAIKVSSISIFANSKSLWGIWPVEKDGSIEINKREVALFECIQSDVISFFKNWIELLFEESNS